MCDRLQCPDLFKRWEMTDNTSETVEVIDTNAMED